VCLCVYMCMCVCTCALGSPRHFALPPHITMPASLLTQLQTHPLPSRLIQTELISRLIQIQNASLQTQGGPLCVPSKPRPHPNACPMCGLPPSSFPPHSNLNAPNSNSNPSRLISNTGRAPVRAVQAPAPPQRLPHVRLRHWPRRRHILRNVRPLRPRSSREDSCQDSRRFQRGFDVE
jgi:hypothetical protein